MMRFKYNNVEYEAVTGTNEEKDAEYIQFNELGGRKPSPIMFVFHSRKTGEISISMHKEGLPYDVFQRFLEYLSINFISRFGEKTEDQGQ